MKKRGVKLLLIGLCLLISFTVGAAEQIVLEFMPEVEITSSRVYLGELARISGDGELASTLREMDLGPAPVPGSQFSLSADRIKSVLKYQYINLDQLEFVDLKPQGVVIHRAAQELDEKRLLDEVYGYIHSRLYDFPGDIEITLRTEIPEVLMPTGEEYYIQIPEHALGYKRFGRISLPIRIILSEEEYRRLYVNLEIKAFDQVVIASEQIERKSRLTEDMFRYEYMDISDVRGEILYSIEELQGKEAVRTIRPGSIMVADYVKEPELVRRNDQVTMVAQFGSVTIQTLGKALDSGAEGDWIWVENLDSGIKVQAQVIGPGFVQVSVN